MHETLGLITSTIKQTNKKENTMKTPKQISITNPTLLCPKNLLN